jgi:hypothetical protein
MKIGLFIDEGEGRIRQIKTIKSQFKIYKPTYIEDVCISSKLLDNDGFDLVIIDYGGLTAMPGNSLGEHYTRYVNQYAEEHPNTLITYITVMGESWLRDEGLILDELHNIRVCNYEDVCLLYEKCRGGNE